MENTHKQSYSISWSDAKKNIYKDDIDLYIPEAKKGKEQTISAEIIDLEDGKSIRFPAFVKDKLAMLEIPKDPIKDKFSETLERVSKLNPRALILYNNEETGDRLAGRLEILGEASRLHTARIKRSTYHKLISHLSFGGKAHILTSISGIPLESQRRMSEFSSWGPAPDLTMKPEITAVGGNIYSTAEDNLYKNMSGTSMASPQVAGASAIIKQYIKEKKIKCDNEADLVKLLLMNTAEPIADPLITEETVPYFVRRQGSGAINLEKALNSKVLVRATGTNDFVADGKLELREISEKKIRGYVGL